MGAATPIGRNVWSSAAAARAGICGFYEHPYMIDTAGEPMRVARAPWLDVSIEGTKRFFELLYPAIDEALVPIKDSIETRSIKVGLALGLPPHRPGRPEDLVDTLRYLLNNRYPNIFSKILTFEVGHSAGHLALDVAIKQCTVGSADTYVVAGVDSYLAPKTLEWIEECDQLHGGGEFNNAWGFIPGEAASAILISSASVAEQFGYESFGEIVSVGIGDETNLIKTEAVCVGKGLTQAFRSALAALAPDEIIHNVYCDLNGEKYRADEYGFSSLRTEDRFRSASDFIALADCWGDVGAASAPLQIIQAVIANRKQYDKGPLSIVWASSEGGERGAAVFRAPG